jgi:hypothetical protein
MARTSKDSKAGDIKAVYDNYAAYKVSNWEPYFNACDKYYAGYKHNKVWPGSKTLRSNLKLQVTSDLIETLYSSLAFTLFFSGGENFFDIVSVDTGQAQALTERLRFILNVPNSTSGQTGLWSMLRTLRYIVKYGIGINAIHYDQDFNRPILTPLTPYDVYWAPHTSEWIDDSPYIFHRTSVDPEVLEQYRDLPGYTLPPASQLREAVRTQGQNDPTAYSKEQAVQLLTGQEVRQSGSRPGTIELIRATTPSTVQWLIAFPAQNTDSQAQGVRLIFEGPNRLEAQPYTAGVYRPLLETFGGISVAKINSGEHDLQQALTNAILDHVDITIVPPRLKGPGNEKKKEWKPGSQIESTNEKFDQPLSTQDFPQAALFAYAESKNRSMRSAGTNEMAISGRPAPSNANRTLGGIQQQNAAREERAFGTIHEIESGYVVPTLLKLLLADRAHNKGKKVALQGQDTSNFATAIDSTALNATLHLEVRGATRMVGVARLSNIFQPLLQYLMNPAIQAEAAKAGMQLDFNQVNRMVNDSLGIDRKYTFYRPMQQEEAAMRQQSELGKSQMQAQSRQQSDELRAKTQIMLEQLKQAGVEQDRAAELLELLMSQVSEAQQADRTAAQAAAKPAPASTKK